MSVVNLDLHIINKLISKFVRILKRIQVECSEPGLRYKDVLLAFSGNTLGSFLCTYDICVRML